MAKTLTRKEFLRLVLAAGGGALLNACGQAPAPTAAPEQPPTREPSTPVLQAQAGPTAEPSAQESAPTPTQAAAPTGKKTASGRFLAEPAAGQIYLSVARGADPDAITRAAIKSLGGMERFVQPGHDVIIKPNICVDYHPPEYAATTNPIVVGALVQMALESGAKRVRVMDNPFGGTAESAYAISGIADAVKAAGGEMEVMSPLKFVKYPIPDGKDIKEWDVYRPAMECDVLIDVPIAKHHSLARLTLGGKNLLGLVATPNRIHNNLGQRLSDLYSLFRPTLTVIDGFRILMDHGPTGGSLEDVKLTQTVIASHDLVAADAYGATLFDLKGEDIAYTVAMAAQGLGTMDLSQVKIEEITL
jgi:uncharacterized protein (DUF362 family)